MPAVSYFNPTGNAYLDGLLSGTKWAGSEFTFSFPSLASFYGPGYGEGEPSYDFEALNAGQRSAVRTIFSVYASVANLTFAEITETSSQHATLRYAESDVPSTAWAYFPTTAPEGGDTWLNNSSDAYDFPVRGNYAWATILHETGHALGLKHPHEVEGAFGAMPIDHDAMEYTVMSYRSYVGGSTSSGYTNETWGYAQSLMMEDVRALQHMYGANYTTNSGNTVYSWSPITGRQFINGVGQGQPGGNRILMNVWDGGGQDTYDFSNYSTTLTVDLRPGAWTTVSTTQLARLGSGQLAHGNISNSFLHHGNTASLVEHAVGGLASDKIVGNDAANRLTGGAGNDSLDGGFGTDTAVYTGPATNYRQVLNADGSWTITDLRSGSPDGIDTLTGIEFLQFSSGLVAIGATPSTKTLHHNVSGWSLEGTGDLNGDGRSDILLRSDRGEVAAWYMNGTGHVECAEVLHSNVSGWSLEGTGDLNGDGRSDILLRSDRGEVAAWYMDSSGAIACATILHPNISSWSLEGTGDFNGDGRSDILLRSDRGEVAAWSMDRSGNVECAEVLHSNMSGWSLEGTGDLNGDGRSDILLRSDRGEVAAWYMDSSGAIEFATILHPNISSWSLEGTGDVNGDGQSEILLRSSVGEVATWYMDSSGAIKYAEVLQTNLSGWSLEGAGDLNGNSRSEILLRSSAGEVASWDLI